jgi:hypothetical protein
LHQSFIDFSRSADGLESANSPEEAGLASSGLFGIETKLAVAELLADPALSVGRGVDAGG